MLRQVESLAGIAAGVVGVIGLLLIVSTILLWLGAILGMFSVGLFVLPATLLALVSLLACGLGSGAAGSPAPSH